MHQMRPSFSEKIPAFIRELAGFLQERGIAARPVGGAVRDLLLGREVVEWDLAVSCPPQRLMELLPGSIPTGIAHGTVTVRWKGRFIEATSYRGDRGCSDGRHPDAVVFGVSLRQDLARRDFTINAMAIDPGSDRIIDPYGGRADLARRLVRCVGDPDLRFSEDGLRVMRAVRFASVLGFSIHRRTRAAIPRSIDVFRKVSIERIRVEFMKMLSAPKPSRGVELLCRTGLLAEIIPELLAGVGFHQNRWHKSDVYRHSLKTMDAVNGDPVLRLAALLHDVSKPACIGGDGPDHTFYGHEKAGAETAGAIMRRLRFSGGEIDRVTRLVALHMFSYSPDWKDGTVRRFISRAGPVLDDLLALQRADIRARGTHIKRSLAATAALEQRIAALSERSLALKVGNLAINGDDIMELFECPGGPRVGSVLAALLELVIDDPSVNTRVRLLALAREMK